MVQIMESNLLMSHQFWEIVVFAGGKIFFCLFGHLFTCTIGTLCGAVAKW